MIYHSDPQGSEAWLAARRGVCTASRFKDCRDFREPTAAQRKEGLKRGEPSKTLLGYAMDLARERCGGRAPAKFQSAAMRVGQVEESPARIVFEVSTGALVEEVGFVTTDDRFFGVSLDGRMDEGAIEIKTMVSSATLFQAVVDGDISEYADQVQGAMWLLDLPWIKLILWAPDLPEDLRQTVIHVERDAAYIEALADDLWAFHQRVEVYAAALRAKAGRKSEPPPDRVPPPWDTDAPAPRAALFQPPKTTPAAAHAALAGFTF